MNYEHFSLNVSRNLKFPKFDKIYFINHMNHFILINIFKCIIRKQQKKSFENVRLQLVILTLKITEGPDFSQN